MKRVIAFWTSIAVALGLVLTACAYGASSGNNGSDNQQPAPKSSFCVPESGSCGTPAPSQPVASADARPIKNPTCELTYDIPRLVPDGMRGFFTIRCKILPTVMLVTAKLQTKNSAGNWVDEGQIFVYNYPNPQHPLFIDTPRGFEWFAHCPKGTNDVWRLDGHWSGLKGNGLPFPNEAEGDTPADWHSDEVTVHC